ncbi:MAG: hypothetical protein U0931_25300 [Vulcanimicrobiota bacterium]
MKPGIYEQLITAATARQLDSIPTHFIRWMRLTGWAESPLLVRLSVPEPGVEAEKVAQPADDSRARKRASYNWLIGKTF